jgi:hypothetical protein
MSLDRNAAGISLLVSGNYALIPAKRVVTELCKPLQLRSASAETVKRAQESLGSPYSAFQPDPTDLPPSANRSSGGARQRPNCGSKLQEPVCRA